VDKKIRIKDLTKIYRKGTIEIPALQNVSIEIEPGRFYAIVGKSGCGKSTLLNLIGGLDKPTSGSIYFNGADLAEMSRKDLVIHRRYNVGMIFQSFNLILSQTALENIILPMIFTGIPKRERIAKGKILLEQVGLADRITHIPNELSGGEAQRVAIARAMANEPEVILADEPTGNLDSQTSEEIVNLLVKLNKDKGLTILMVTHDLETAENVSDKIIRLKDGMVI